MDETTDKALKCMDCGTPITNIPTYMAKAHIRMCCRKCGYRHQHPNVSFQVYEELGLAVGDAKKKNRGGGRQNLNFANPKTPKEDEIAEDFRAMLRRYNPER